MIERQSEALKQFLQRVQDQIKSKEAKCFVQQELQVHILERKKEFIAQGNTEEEAETLALNQMGNPISLGKEMQKIHKPKVDWLLVVLFSAVLLIGTVPYYFLSFDISSVQTAFFHSQMKWSLLSVTVVIAFMFFDYRKLKKLWPFLFAAALILSLQLEFFATEINGRSYLSIGPFTINYWSISILYFVSFVGMLSSNLKGNKLVGTILLMFWLPIFFFLKSADLNLPLFYFITLVIVLAVSPAPKHMIKKLLIMKGTIIAFAIPLFFFTVKPHQVNRLFGFLNPEKDPSGSGYLYIQMQEVLQSAQLIGSNEAIMRLPLMHTELIFVSLVYSFGWLFGGIVLLVIGVFLYRMMYTVKKTKDALGKMVVYTGISIIGLASVWNVLMVFGLLPIIGIGLPFISYGGQSMVMYSVFIGLILSVYRRKDLVLNSNLVTK
jgi:cell division protein FtsW (lipid II flippase)